MFSDFPSELNSFELTSCLLTIRFFYVPLPSNSWMNTSDFVRLGSVGSSFDVLDVYSPLVVRNLLLFLEFGLVSIERLGRFPLNNPHGFG